MPTKNEKLFNTVMSGKSDNNIKFSDLIEYSGAAEPPFRKIGNRESGAGNRHTAIVTFASLLA